MIKLAVFDLDDTLAKIGEGVEPEALGKLKALERRGVQIAVCSGKPCYYLCGFMRQAGFPEAILLGENGATVQFGVALPPARAVRQPYSAEAAEGIALLREKIRAALPHLWFQPNEVALTPFPTTPEEFRTIQAILDSNPAALRDLAVFRHGDSFDILPANIDKRTGLALLCALLRLTPQEVAAVGNGENDYSMLAFAGLSIGVNLPDRGRAQVNVSSVAQAVAVLQQKTEP